MHRRAPTAAAAVVSALACVLALAACTRPTPGIHVAITDLGPTVGNTPGAVPTGRVIALAVSKDGQRAYAAAKHAGLWRSDDGGVSWRQLTQEQPADALGGPCPTGAPNPCRLESPTIQKIVVAPDNPDLVFVATANDPSKQRDGVYRSIDGGHTWERVLLVSCDGGSTKQPIGDLRLAPDDPTKLWASAGCAVAYSVVTPREPLTTVHSGSVSASAIGAPHTWTTVKLQAGTAWHLAVGPQFKGVSRSVWACGGGVLWHSLTGGDSWKPVRTTGVDRLFCGAPGGIRSGGTTSDTLVVPNGRLDTVYGIGSSSSRWPLWLRPCGGQDQPSCPEPKTAWIVDTCGCSRAVLQVVDRPDSAVVEYPPPPVLGEGGLGSAYGSGESSLMGYDQPDGTQLIGMGDTGNFFVTDRLPPVLGGWRRLDGPQPSDDCRTTTGGLSCSDARCPQRLGNQCGFHRGRIPGLHVDIHSLAFGGQLVMHVQPTSAGLLTAMAGGCISTLGPGRGVILQSDDGGLMTSTDCGKSWRPAAGLSTNRAALMAGFSRPGAPPVLFLGGDDDGNWWSIDGGGHWSAPPTMPSLTPDPFGCGDCDGFYIDQVGAVIAHSGRDDTHKLLDLYTWSIAGMADPRVPTVSLFDTAPAGPLVAPSIYPFYQIADENKGYAPLVLTLPGEAPVAHGDVVATASSTRIGLTTGNTAAATWVVRSRGDGHFVRVGPNLPSAAIPTVQAVGGHTRTVYYVGVRHDDDNATAETDQLLVSIGTPGKVTGWRCIVPGPGKSAYGCAAPKESGRRCLTAVCHAYRFWADPFDSRVVYVLDEDGVKETTDGGNTWHLQPSLSRWLLDNGAGPAQCVVCTWNDDDSPMLYILFVPGEPGTRFAMGVNGLFMTLDGTTEGATRPSGTAEHWHRLIDPASLACLPNRAFFDVSGSPARSLYVGCISRGVLRLSGIPGPGDEASLDQHSLVMDIHTEDSVVRYPVAPITYVPRPQGEPSQSADTEEPPTPLTPTTA
jgi:hypothetical protein